MQFHVLSVACLLAVLAIQRGHAQETAPVHPVAEASRLRDARDFRGAVAVLRGHLEQHPQDGEAIRMLAQTLYWSGDIRGADSAYTAGMERNPEDLRLRLEFARMLVETRSPARARALLARLRGDPHNAGEAESLLGTAAYWQGDLAVAERHFRAALAHTPAHADATRQLREIRGIASPWVRFAGEFQHDDQPLDRLKGSGEAGWFLTPLQSLAIRAMPQRLSASDTEETVLAGEVAYNAFWPGARLETEATAGAVQRSSATDPQLIGRLGVGLRLPGHIALRVRAERAPYLWTQASVATPVMTTSASGLLDWNDPRGWIGQAGFLLQQFPDQNRIYTTYVWALAPVVRAAPAELKLGYGLNYQDAAQNRFELAPSRRRGVGRGAGNSLDSLAGGYRPYYTPQNVQVHSATGAATLQIAKALVLRANGAYGVFARENAPVFVQAGASGVGAGQPAPQLSFYSRTFHPWNARAAFTATLPGGFSASVFGEHSRTAFYAYTGAGVDVLYQLRRN